MDVGRGDVLEVGDGRADHFQLTRIGLGAGQGVQPVGVGLLALGEQLHPWLAGAFQLVPGDLLGAQVGGDLVDGVEEQLHLCRRHLGEGVDRAVAGEDLRGVEACLGLIGRPVGDAQLVEQPGLQDLFGDPQIAGRLHVGVDVHAGPRDQRDALVGPSLVVTDQRRRIRRREVRDDRLRGGDVGPGPPRQGAEGRGHQFDRPRHGHVADDGDLDGALGEGLVQDGVQVVQVLSGDVQVGRVGPARIVVVQQIAQIPLQHPVGRGGEIVEDRGDVRLDPVERLRPPAGGGDIGGEDLQLRVQVFRPRAAGEDKAVVAGVEAQAVDLRGQHPLDVVDGHGL